MNGNDIVDLNIAKIPTGMRRSRFLDKIFSPSEKEAVYSGRVGEWSMWAVKEAVYKAHQRKFQLPRIFDPKSIKVHIRETSTNSVLAEAQYMGYDYMAKGFITSDYVHFTATGCPHKTLYQEIHNVSSMNIKYQLIKIVSQKLGLEMKDLVIKKDKNLIPQMMYKNVNLYLPFSISHHGEFGAFSFQLINY